MKALSFHDLAFMRMVQGGGGSGGGSTTVSLAELTAFWRLNESLDSDGAVDATGNGSDLGMYSLDVPTATGKVDGGRIGAYDTWFESGDLPAFDVTGDWSMFGWTKLVYEAWPQAALSLGYADNVLIRPESNYIRMDALVMGGQPFFTVAGDAMADWVFFAAGYIAASKKLWLTANGSGKSYRTVPSAPLPVGYPYRIVRIGSVYGSGNATEIGVDNIGFMAGELNAAQIAWLYNGGAGRDITT